MIGKTEKAVRDIIADSFTTAEPRFGHEGDPPLDDFITYDRIFVFHLPWYRRFIIWLFPRMFHLENYPTECEKSPSGSHQCDCPTGEPAPICQYCGKEMLW